MTPNYTNFKWVQNTASPDRWELHAQLVGAPPNPDGTPSKELLVVAKKQGEEQWRVSYNKNLIGWPSENQTSLNSSAKSALMKLHGANIKAPWINGSIFSPMIGEGLSDVEAYLTGQKSPPPPPAAAPPAALNRPEAETLRRNIEAALKSDARQRAEKIAEAVESDRPTSPAPAVGSEASAAEPETKTEAPRPKVKVPGTYYEPHFPETRKKLMDEEKIGTFGAMMEAVAHGAKVSVADESANAMLQIAETLFGDAYPEMIKTPAGKAMMKAFTSLSLHYAADNYPNMIGGEQMAEGLKAATVLVTEAAARDLLQPQMAKITPLVKQLAELGTATLKP